MIQGRPLSVIFHFAMAAGLQLGLGLEWPGPWIASLPEEDALEHGEAGGALQEGPRSTF